MANIFDLSRDQQEFLELLTSEDTVLTEEQQNAIIDGYLTADENFKKKLDSYRYLILEMEARADIRLAHAKPFEDRAKQLKAQAQADKRLAERLAKRIQYIMEIRGEDKLETEEGAFTISGTGGVAPLIYPEIWDREPAMAPEAFHRRRIELDKDALRKALESGEVVPEARIGERSRRLRIK